jgi:hypothetical protein
MGMQASPLRQASLHPEIPPMGTGLIGGVIPGLNDPYLLGGDDLALFRWYLPAELRTRNPKISLHFDAVKIH